MIDQDEDHIVLTTMQHIQLELLDDDTVTPIVVITQMPIPLPFAGYKLVSIYSLAPYGPPTLFPVNTVISPPTGGLGVH